MTALPLAPPAGMRDLLHPRADARVELRGRLGRLFSSHGYDLVLTPPFEHADVLERGLATVDRRDLLRFVEPETGEVALLRPDITPQIARVVSTRLSDRPPPFRLRYGGTVIRRRRGRARQQQQIAQVGVEHIGVQAVTADVEVATLACRAAEVAGLSDFRLELRHVRITGALLSRIDEDARPDAESALARKDLAELESILARLDVDGPTRAALTTLPRLYGGREVIDEARAHLPGEIIEGHLKELEALALGLDAANVGDRVALDLGETRGMAYYTGASFVLLAEGPGEPIGAGGRYDELLGRFGAPRPATGFAMDLGNLEWGLSQHGQVTTQSSRLLFFGNTRDNALVGALREAGAQVAELPGAEEEEALAFARAWSYDAAVELGTKNRATRIADDAELVLGGAETEALLSWARG